MTGEAANTSATGRAPAQSESGCRAELAADVPGRRREAALGLIGLAETGLVNETVEALKERLLTDPDADVRQFAAEALGVAGTGAEVARRAMEADHDAWVRAEAVVAYSRAGGGPSTLREILNHDENGWVRRNALIALAKTGNADQALLADRLKNDPHRAVREYAADYLGEQATEPVTAVKLLAAILARDPSAFVRAKAAESLGDLGTDRAIQAIEDQGLNDRSDDVQRTAKRALAHARGVTVEAIQTDDSSRRCSDERQ